MKTAATKGLKAAVVYLALGYLAGKRKDDDRELLGDNRNANVTLDISGIVKIDGKRYTINEQIDGHLNIGEPPAPTQEKTKPSTELIIAALLQEIPRVRQIVLDRIATDWDNDDLVADPKEIESVKAFLKSLEKLTGEEKPKSGALTFTKAS